MSLRTPAVPRPDPLNRRTYQACLLANVQNPLRNALLSYWYGFRFYFFLPVLCRCYWYTCSVIKRCYHVIVSFDYYFCASKNRTVRRCRRRQTPFFVSTRVSFSVFQCLKRWVWSNGRRSTSTHAVQWPRSCVVWNLGPAVRSTPGSCTTLGTFLKFL